jgi:hypothetical protein
MGGGSESPGNQHHAGPSRPPEVRASAQRDGLDEAGGEVQHAVVGVGSPPADLPRGAEFLFVWVLPDQGALRTPGSGAASGSLL